MRSSEPERSTIIVHDEAQVAALEARNALRQYDEVVRLANERFGNLSLTADDVRNLQRLATEGIYTTAGQFRQIPIHIGNSPHQPPPWQEVPTLVDEMCRVANADHDPLHCSAYLMWRLNWIHPFGDGNGRTSRAVSYLALCAGFQMILPGTTTVPDLIVRDKRPYYAALDAADAAWSQGNLDVSVMEKLIDDLLTEQLKTGVS
jgi:Fic family protein